MKKYAIICGAGDSGVQKKAIENLAEFLLDYTHEYPICMVCGEERDLSNFRRIYVGTKENNAFIQEHSQAQFQHAEEYSIKVQDETVMIEGADDNGVLYGCVDFYNKYLIKCEFDHNPALVLPNPANGPFPDFELQSAPAVKDRGIWTWGHVIYDYKGFFDNMAKLKMNTVIIWNDAVPYNAKEIISYAHSCGIKIIFGFAWGWDTNCYKIDLKTIDALSPRIFENFEKNYSGLGLDGIYFQSFTEIREDSIDGILVAQAVTDFVNRTAQLFFEKYPELDIQFGLHATSVKEKLEYLKKVNPKIKIVWEDCGAFPFSYLPKNIETFEETREFAEKIAVLRGQEDNFGVVTKGFTKLNWLEFEHVPGAVNFGVSSKHMKRDRVIRKSKIWKYLQAYWLTNADKAYEMVRTLRGSKDGDLEVTALVEDGMFEENVMFPVALYAEMLWDCDSALPEMVQNVALREYVEFA